MFKTLLRRTALPGWSSAIVCAHRAARPTCWGAVERTPKTAPGAAVFCRLFTVPRQLLLGWWRVEGSRLQSELTKGCIHAFPGQPMRLALGELSELLVPIIRTW